MEIQKPIYLALAAAGGMSACFSLILFFSTTVYAACSAYVECVGGAPVECSCAGSGLCTSSPKCVSCACGNEPPTPRQCCKGDEEILD